jgi:enamine deaminase RidA (YjgF/YER057c/UK114 family)
MTVQRESFCCGSPFECAVGYARVVRVGPLVYVSGTAAAGDDAAAQAAEVLRRIESALAEAGATVADVVRTRVYLTDMADFAAVGHEHAQVFGDIRPATAVVEVAALAAPDLVVEIEADAVVGGAWPT